MEDILGLLSGIGELADKATGGRALRGLASGRPRELASIVPFSDTLGITDPRQQASGRDVTDTWGLTTRGANDFGSKALGFGADMLLNPLSIAGAGAAFKAAPTFAKGLGAAAKSLTGLDAIENLGQAVKNFGKDEGGWLKLPFDKVKYPPEGLTRSSPEWVNNKTFFHGTGHPNLVGPDLSPLKSNPEALFGRGIYTTSDPEVAKSYATSSNKRHGPAGESKIPTVYELQSNFGRVLDAEEPMTPEVESLLRGGLERYNKDLDRLLTIPGFKSKKYEIGQLKYHPQTITQEYANPEQILGGHGPILGKYRGLLWNSYYDDIANKLKAKGLQMPDPTMSMTNELREGGFDALTHTGGMRWGRGQSPHQVVIGLDPNDVGGIGRSTPYKIWQAFKNFLADEGGWLKIPERPLSPGPELSAWKRGIQRDFEQAVVDPSTPVGQFHKLVHGAGANPVGAEHDINFLTQAAPGSFAFYNPGNKLVVPNVPGSPEAWLDMDNFRFHADQSAKSVPGFFSSNVPEHTAAHEIGHALHHQANRVENTRFFRDLDAKYPGFTDTYGDQIAKLLSGYGSTSPSEFVAEQFARNALERAGLEPVRKFRGRNRTLSRELADVYKELGGPEQSNPLIRLLTQAR